MTSLTLPMQSIIISLKQENYYQIGILKTSESIIAMDIVGRSLELSLSKEMEIRIGYICQNLNELK